MIINNRNIFKKQSYSLYFCGKNKIKIKKLSYSGNSHYSKHEMQKHKIQWHQVEVYRGVLKNKKKLY